ncbi:MAG: carboxypeptidase regulatory-like domain-containing protein, partial [Vicinamibacteraceae bacterium]
MGCARLRVVALAICLMWIAGAAHAQVRTTGQIVGTAQDSSGAVVPGAEIEVTDVGTAIAATTTSNNDGGFVFPALQPGRYRLLATAPGFEPVVVEALVVETGRATNVTVQFQVAGVAEEVKVQAQAAPIETTSNTVSTTVANEEIAKLPLSSRSVLNFSLLTPGTASSAGSRFSSFNGLPGGAINITLDGVNNNSQRFRSGGTSFFTFAPVRLGAIEEVTMSTAGLAADAGAQGAVQVQFVTKRGSNEFHGQIFDQVRHDALNANNRVDNARGIPKNQLRQHEFGANLGGPLIRNKLFFFANYEQVYQPGENTETRTVLTPEAQQGVFRYVAGGDAVRTANLLDIARANGFPAAVDPFVASQLAAINDTLGGGVVGSNATDLLRNSLSFVIPADPRNLFPTGRVDWQASSSLAVRAILNLHWRDLVRDPQFPGLEFVNGGFTSNYYILSTGADWTLSPNLFNQFSFGFQSNAEEFNPGNTPAVYGERRVPFPLDLTTLTPTDNVLPIPRNNPVYNISNTLTLLKGSHTLTFGGTLRHTSMWESTWGGAAGGPEFNLGVSGGDPVSAIFDDRTLPGIGPDDLADALALYALLTGRISSISGVHNVDEGTHEYGLNPAVRREAQTVGGLYFQDSWRATPRFTLNYGLRWEFSGAAHNTNDIYTNPTPEHLLGPSAAPFQPGVLSDVGDPQLFQQSNPYDADLVNPAPNVGFAWTPDGKAGFLGTLLGEGQSVIRASAGLNYYDEGLIAFQTAAGDNPGLTQSVFLDPGMRGFPPGGLGLGSPIPPLARFPASFSFPLSQSLFTFANGFSTIDPNIKTPSILNWTVGFQREVGPNAAFEIRYVGNRGFNLWRSYDLNEVNIFENGFLEEFENARRNLEINRAHGRSGFADNDLPGQAPLPLFEAAFGAVGSQPALEEATGFGNGTFVTMLEQGEAGGLAEAMAGDNLYLCRLVGSALPACGDLDYNAPGAYPINFFQANPFAAGESINLLTDEASSRYHGLQLQYRQRYGRGLSITANYTYSRAMTDRYSDSPAATVDYITLRDKELDEGPTVFDLRHAFQTYWTYELPFGRDRQFGIDNPLLNQVIGGWNMSGVLRIQSGRPFYLTSGRQTFNNRDAGVVLNGITEKELQNLITVRPGSDGNVFFVDERLVGPDGRANPELISSPSTPGELGERVFLYGPGFWNLDIGIAKRFDIGRVWMNFEALFL